MNNGSTRRFFILDEPCPSSEIGTMIGRVVANHRRPSDDIVPPQALPPSEPCARQRTTHKTPGDIVPGIHPKPSVFANATLELSGESKAGVSATSGSVLGVQLSVRKSQTISIKSRVMRRYALAGLDERKTRRYFNLLMADAGYARAVRRLMLDSGRSEVYFVVGLIAAEGTVWSRQTTVKKESCLKAEVSISAVAALPVDFGVGAGPSITRANGVSASYEVEEEQIFAMAYDIVKKLPVFDRDAPMYIGSKVVHKGMMKPKADHLAMGNQSASETDNEDEAEQDDLGSEDDWNVAHGGCLVEVVE